MEQPIFKDTLAFVPAEDALLEPRSTGERRKLAKVEAVPIRWPTTTPERRVAFKMWRRIAMQILHRERVNFRLMAVIPEYLNQKSGTLWPTNFTLAWEGGECDERTIKREVAQYRDLGLLIVDLGWRQTPQGHKRTRTMRLALPKVLGPDIHLRDDDHGDNSGPYGGDDHRDNSGPSVGDNSGPFTFDDTFEKKEASGAA